MRQPEFTDSGYFFAMVGDSWRKILIILTDPDFSEEKAQTGA